MELKFHKLSKNVCILGVFRDKMVPFLYVTWAESNEWCDSIDAVTLYPGQIPSGEAIIVQLFVQVLGYAFGSFNLKVE